MIQITTQQQGPMDALARAIQIVGSASALARQVGASVSSPSMWRARGRVPAEYCPGIERATGGAVRCEELRPDVEWGVLRGEAAAGRARNVSSQVCAA